MNSVFLRNGGYAAHVTLWLGPLFCDFGEEMFKSRRSDIHEHADRLIGVIFESVSTFVAKCMQRAALVGSYQERITER